MLPHNGQLTIPVKWQDIIFDPIGNKSEFDNFERSQVIGDNTSTTPALRFLENNTNKFTRILNAVISKQEIETFIKNLNKNQQIYFALVCSYPKHEGKYTHWLTLLEKTTTNTAIVAGDLSPYGITDKFVAEVNFDALANDIIDTLQQSPTTKNSNVLSNSAIKSGARNSNKFTSNIGIATFN